MSAGTESLMDDRDVDAIAAAVVAKLGVSPALDAALDVLERDSHRWSDRPCGTCRGVTLALGRPFGCNRYAELRDA